jgi:hypothetical protein
VRKTLFGALVAAQFLTVGAENAIAATINVQSVPIGGGNNITVIAVEGEMLEGDQQRFADAAIRTDTAIVMLNSPGGSLEAGIEIGKAIRIKGFETLVSTGFSCASACALAWLGGRVRFMAAGSTVGFHAASSSTDPTQAADSVGNALVGAYLNQLGLPNAAIAYITQPQPNDIRWLTFDDAERLGIDVKPFVESGGAPANPSASVQS